MTPSLTFTGRLDPPGAKPSRAEVRDWLARAAVWFETRGDAVLAAALAADGDGKPVLCVSYHPAADDVEVRLSASGVVRLSAVTGPVGPGYHAYLCADWEAFAADFGITPERADDPTGFAATADPAALVDAFLGWLGAACRTLSAARRGPGPVPLGLPADHGFTHPGPVLTPLGPRSWEWAAAVAADPAAGVDVFPWWAPDLDAEFFRNRALTLLWGEFPWRAPRTEDEGELLDQILADLELAHALDPAGPVPWREWAAAVAALDGDDAGLTVQTVAPELRQELQRRTATLPPDPSPAGYRLFPVRVAVGGGWSVEVPGAFADGWVDDRTWVGWDGGRRVTVAAGGPLAPREATVTEFPDGAGRSVWRLSGTRVADGTSLAYAVEFADPADRDWATGVWRSLRPTVAPGSTTSVA